jgi:quercetin dioxygenase-like cupin family protein
MYPEPGALFPTWKSTFLQRVTFPSGQPHIVGCGIYNMQMDEAFTKDVVDRAVALVERQGPDAFPRLRDKTGPYFFFETYVFVILPDGTGLVNPAQPSLEGKNIMALKDLNGKKPIQECVDEALDHGSGWVDYFWYKPGQNLPARKHTYVRKAQFGEQTYIVGSGYYPGEGAGPAAGIKKISWNKVQLEHLNQSLTRRTVFGEQGTLAQLSAGCGNVVPRHSHGSEEYSWVTSGTLQFGFDDRHVEVHADEVILIPSHVPHSVVALEDTTFVDFFSPARADWLRGEDQYLRTSREVDKSRTHVTGAFMDTGISPLHE